MNVQFIYESVKKQLVNYTGSYINVYMCQIFVSIFGPFLLYLYFSFVFVLVLYLTFVLYLICICLCMYVYLLYEWVCSNVWDNLIFFNSLLLSFVPKSWGFMQCDLPLGKSVGQYADIEKYCSSISLSLSLSLSQLKKPFKTLILL